MGIWLNYESVNGLDFWNNSTAIPLADRKKYGTIVHHRVVNSKATLVEASLDAISHWIAPDQSVVLEEVTRYVFFAKDQELIIDRITTLTALEKEVFFKDTKDGFIAIRLSRELEQPSVSIRELIGEDGQIIKMVDSAKAATGLYLNSEGQMGDAAWGVRARWCTMNGRKNGENISVTLMDHPRNVGYPTYWHARGYGLFAANPLGQEIFSKGKESLHFRLAPKQSVIFRYRFIIQNGKMADQQYLNDVADQFAKLY
jgi:hypothetical protein